MNERQEKIKEFIDENGEAKLCELEKMFPDFSSMTIRRDLEKLETLGEVIRTRSGVKSIAHLSRLNEALYSERAKENIAEKASIARIAHKLIKQRNSVFLDTGTTVTELARLLKTDKLFIITAAPNIALECIKNSEISVFMVGGKLSSGNLSVSGVNAVSFLDEINIDIAIMATSGVTKQNGFTCGNYDESQLKRRAIEKASKVIMLMDSSKYGKSLPFTFAELSDIDILVTDEKINRELVAELQKKEGIEVLY